MAVHKNVRDVVSQTDLIMVVGILKRVFRRNQDITDFLNKVDDQEELDRLYEALGVLIGLVEDDDDKPVEEEPHKGKKQGPGNKIVV